MTPAGLGVPEGVPNANDLAIDEQWSELFSDQLASVRKTAENWRNGLAAVLGLVSIFTVVQAPAATKDLEPWAARLTGLALICSATFAILGSVAALRAAYGVPQRMSRAEFRRLGGRAGLDLQQADRSRRQLTRAQVLTYLALGAFGAGVALGWYGPQKATEFVRLTTTSDVVVCGTLVRSGDGTLQIDSTTAGSTVVKLPAVASLDVVESCDER